jgi:hypothetical protein
MVLAEGESEGEGQSKSDVSMDVNVCEGSKVGVDPEQEWVIRVILRVGASEEAHFACDCRG